jgi:hypothetical protein
MSRATAAHKISLVADNAGRSRVRTARLPSATPQITDPLPLEVAESFSRLVGALDKSISPRQLDRNPRGEL